jgi:hypothetical protein
MEREMGRMAAGGWDGRDEPMGVIFDNRGTSRARKPAAEKTGFRLNQGAICGMRSIRVIERSDKAAGVLH